HRGMVEVCRGRGAAVERVSVTAAIIPPHDFTIERAVLGAPLLEAELLPAVLALETEHYFFEEVHRVIHRVMKAMAAEGRTVDATTLPGELLSRGHVAAQQHVPLLFDDGSIPAHLPGYIAELEEYWRRRRALQMGLDLQQKALDGDSISLLESITQQVREVIE